MRWITPLPLGLSAADVVALVLLALAWFGIGRLVERPPASRPSVSVLMKRYRREWMRQFLRRDPRIFDGNILTTLREGTSFFASACMIALGGGMALIGVSTQDPEAPPRQWIVPEVGWDGASFDGLRALQAATGSASSSRVVTKMSRHSRATASSWGSAG